MDYEELTDEALLALIVEEDRQALECLYTRYGSRVYSLARRMLTDPGASEEVAQDVFLSVWRRASSYQRGRGKFTTWLFGIAHHRAIDELRRRYRGRMRVSETIDDHPNIESPQPLPADLAVASSENALVRAAMEELPEPQRAVLELSYFGGFTQVEISEMLAQPLGTVKTRMRLGLKKLRIAVLPLLDRQEP